GRNMLNIPDGNLEGKILWDYIPYKQVSEALTELLNTPDTAEKAKFAEIDMSSNNISRFFKATTNPVTTPKGEKLGVVTVLRDITLEKEIDKMKDDFLHSITHDLRNPMTSIRGFLKFLSDGIGGPLTQQQRKMIETIDRASSRLLGMINDILDLAKLESGRIDLQLVKCDLLQIANRVLELLQPQIEKKQIRIKVELLDGKKEAVIVADVQLMERLLNNLVGNAIKFTPENGSISVLISDMEDKVETKVIDTGEGIPQEYLNVIFDKFKQVTGQRKGGTGLGLAICKYIVEAHKGKIWVESKLNEGSKFCFYIPKNLTLTPNGEIK
ncbi:MAG: ATP-binding protein, partial [Elusimicrobiota bacterium]|nr:ATP-binding protein [Elusimicrobiota bacterium]